MVIRVLTSAPDVGWREEFQDRLLAAVEIQGGVKATCVLNLPLTFPKDLLTGLQSILE